MPVQTTVSLFSINDPAPAQIYTLSLHDALPISDELAVHGAGDRLAERGLAHAGRTDEAQDRRLAVRRELAHRDRKSTRLNSSHVRISYAVFCLKKKKHKPKTPPQPPYDHCLSPS